MLKGISGRPPEGGIAVEGGGGKGKGMEEGAAPVKDITRKTGGTGGKGLEVRGEEKYVKW